MSTVKILAFSGSLRAASFNKKLLLQACDFLKELGCEINYLDLKSLELPLFNADNEDKDGLPPGATKLIAAMQEADALCLGNPEYNSGITGAMKNAIDWASRADANPFAGKPVLLVGTSPGIWGASKSHWMTRQILTHLKAIVTPAQITIPSAEAALDDKGLKNPAQVKFLHDACAELVKFAGLFRKT